MFSFLCISFKKQRICGVGMSFLFLSQKNSPVKVPQKQDFCHFVSEGQGLGQSGLNS